MSVIHMLNHVFNSLRFPDTSGGMYLAQVQATPLKISVLSMCLKHPFFTAKKSQIFTPQKGSQQHFHFIFTYEKDSARCSHLRTRLHNDFLTLERTLLFSQKKGTILGILTLMKVEQEDCCNSPTFDIAFWHLHTSRDIL